MLPCTVRFCAPFEKIPSVISQQPTSVPSGCMKLSKTLMVLPLVITMPFPLHGPISDCRIVMFVELLMTTQSPFGLVMCRFCTTTPFWPDKETGPDGVSPPPPELALLFTVRVSEAVAELDAVSYALT